ncbi:MAG: DEAD/DEAH box helicase [Candidatus Nanopelagicales bacterium]|nr:DEAD/DEAH box helicase [Candidatus Nanopelagicales bacterium]
MAGRTAMHGPNVDVRADGWPGDGDHPPGIALLRDATRPPDIPGLAARLAADPRAVHVRDLPARPGLPGQWPAWLDPSVVAAYQRCGIRRPWRHQQRTAELAWGGRHVVLATGTASGKSAAFGMPGLTAALAQPEAPGRRGSSVLYVSPTKALAHDQLAGLAALALPGLRAGALDGDTPDEQRDWARAHARWLVTNPDMLHRGILPAHERWRGFLRALRFVVVDEAHAYRGVFGSHVALVLRRLRRVAALHGAEPTFIAASATVADPGRTAARLLGVDVDVVDVDDSARGPVHLVLWRPGAATGPGAGERPPTAAPAPAGPLDAVPPGWDGVDVADPDRAGSGGPGRGALGEAGWLMAALVDQGVRTLTFARSRRGVEVVAGRVRERARQGGLVRAYRGGYLPEERRALEADLRSGRLLGLAATNALELGIDVSGLDAVLLAGWPGTRASFWQQVGRAGRRGDAALAVLVPREDPLDQYVVAHPEVLTGHPVEATVLDPDNPYVLAGHLCAAAAEAPLAEGECGTWFGAGAEALCATLAERGLLRRRRDGWYWTDGARPADLVDLRGTRGGPVRVVEEGTGRLLGTVDPPAAPAAVHEGALYVHQGATFEVRSLDLDDRVAVAAATVTDLSTHARSVADVTLEGIDAHHTWGPVGVGMGEVEVTSRVTSYLVRRWPSGEVLAEHPLELPPTTLRTTGMWWTVPDAVLAEAGIGADEVAGAVHALEHAAIGILPLLATCDRWDLGGVSTARHPQTGVATIVVHDGHPGGVGFAERGFHAARHWLEVTTGAIAACPCETGCPSCVQSPKCGNGNEPLAKDAALRLGRAMLACAPA